MVPTDVAEIRREVAEVAGRTVAELSPAEVELIDTTRVVMILRLNQNDENDAGGPSAPAA